MSSTYQDTQIIDYQPEHHQRFKEINVQWITRNFVVEDIDEKILGNLDEYILKNGGAILIANTRMKLLGPVPSLELIF